MQPVSSLRVMAGKNSFFHLKLSDPIRKSGRDGRARLMYPHNGTSLVYNPGNKEKSRCCRV
jgi:hypothetical protein